MGKGSSMLIETKLDLALLDSVKDVHIVVNNFWENSIMCNRSVLWRPVS